MIIVKKDKLTELADHLINEIISNKSDPFTEFIVVVPNIIVEQWFKSYWLNKTDKVLMNVKFKRIDQLIDYIYFNNKHILSLDKVALLLADILNKKDFGDISEYYKDNSINLFDLANNLATLFNEYEKECFTCEKNQKEILKELKNNNLYISLEDIINNVPKKDIKNIFIFGFSKLENIYYKALGDIDCIYYEQNEEIICDRKITDLCSASSKEREIEYVHGEICKILKDNDVKLSDILIYAPNIEEYKGAIKKVFSNVGNRLFPEVPYAILSSASDISNTGNAIRLLYNVLYKDEFTRTDFYKLISNPDVITARKINQEKINDIIDALDSMCVYRNNEKCDEWLYGIRRLLLSKLIGGNFDIENTISLDDEKYLPYGNISMDDESINTLVSIADDIIEFKEKYKEELKNNNVSYFVLKEELDKWLSFTDDDNETNYYYKEALKVLDFIIDEKLNLSIDIVIDAMVSKTNNLTVYPNNIFNSKVTFLNFNEKNILSSKYMFFIGIGSNIIPRKTVDNELDQRKNKELNSDIDKRVLNMLRNNAIEEYFSYVNINLLSQEEYKPSTLLNGAKPTKTLTLSENRKYEELYSKSEFEKKKYSSNLIKNDSYINTNSAKLDKDIVYPDTIKYKELSSLIEENLMSKMKRLFSDYDDTLDNVKKSYEPLEIDNITKAQIRKEIIVFMINNNLTEIEQGDIDKILEKYRVTHKVPYDYLSDKDIKEIITYKNNLSDDIKLYQGFDISLTTYVNEKQDGEDTIKQIDWKLLIKDDFLLAINEDEKKLYFDNFKINKSKISDYKDLYIISLAYVYKELNNFSNYTVILGHDKLFNVNYKKAEIILNKLYNEYCNYDNLCILPIDYIDEEKKDNKKDKSKKDKYDQIIKIGEDHKPWHYFDDKKIVDVRENAGYTRDDFEEVWEKYVNFVRENILYIDIDEEE